MPTFDIRTTPKVQEEVKVRNFGYSAGQSRVQFHRRNAAFHACIMTLDFDAS